MKTKLIIGLIAISLILISGCNIGIQQKEYTCSDGKTIVSDSSICPENQPKICSSHIATEIIEGVEQGIGVICEDENGRHILTDKCEGNNLIHYDFKCIENLCSEVSQTYNCSNLNGYKGICVTTPFVKCKV